MLVGESTDKIEQWLESCCKGDSAALEALLLHFHDPLMAFIRGLVKGNVAGWTTPEDLMQDTLMEAFRRGSRLEARGAGAFLAWLKTIARTRLINQIDARKATKRGGHASAVTPVPDADHTAQTIMHVIAASDPTPSLSLRRRELQTYLAQAIGQLDPERAAVLDLRYRQGLAIAEIASQTGKGESAVKMLISRTIQELRQRLAAIDPNFTISL